MWTATVMLSPIDSRPQIISYRSSRLNTCPGWRMRNSKSSYSRFLSGNSTPFLKICRASSFAMSGPTVSTVGSAGDGCSRSTCARCAFTRATSTLGENGFSI